MKQIIQLRLGQQLTMTPQLQQAIKLLQLSTFDLQREIQNALDSNMMLEMSDDHQTPNAQEKTQEITPESIDDRRSTDSELYTEQMSIPSELPIDSQWSDTFDHYYGGSNSLANDPDADDYDPFNHVSLPQTLHDHLNWQLNLAHLNDREQIIAATLIDAIDGDGYLRLDITEVPALLTAECPGLHVSDVEVVLHYLQSLDPPGVAARDPRECLLLQLRHLHAHDWVGEYAIQICERYFEELVRNDLDELCQALSVSKEQLATILKLIRSLQPRPGATVTEVRNEYIVPDVLVTKREGRWLVELNPETTPKLRVNSQYARLIRRADQTADNVCLKTHLQEARWFIKSLASRHETILRVAKKIVELQHDFFEFGEEAMKPLILRDVAEALALHESTISRVTMRKYMYTPRGTFEFKFFFSSHVNTNSGGECSSTAIRAFIRKLVAAEIPNKPLSDQKIADVLLEQGIQVARRTVAKYREAMGIPPSNERKRLA
jgi:RNA polymerase sigma-54 factor